MTVKLSKACSTVAGIESAVHFTKIMLPSALNVRRHHISNK